MDSLLLQPGISSSQVKLKLMQQSDSQEFLQLTARAQQKSVWNF